MAGLWSSAVLRLVHKLNNFAQPGSSKLSCKPFVVDGVQVGYITPHISSYLKAYTSVFVTVAETDGEITHITLNPEIKTFTERTKKVAEVMKDLKQKDVFSTLRGWRDEKPVLYDGEISDLLVRNSTVWCSCEWILHR